MGSARTNRLPHPRRARRDLRHTRPRTRGRSWLTRPAAASRRSRSSRQSFRRRRTPRGISPWFPTPDDRFYRAREGQVGVTEALALAQAVRDLVDADRDVTRKRAIVAVVDLPSQAYGRYEEIAGLHQAMAVTVDAYHAARVAGHPIVALVVGTALRAAAYARSSGQPDPCPR